MISIEPYIGFANLLREDCARIARQIEEAAQAVNDARRLPQELQTRLKEIRDTITMITVGIEAEVTNETVDVLSTTPKFKNADARKAEVAKRVSTHQELTDYARELRILETQKLDADIQLGSAQDLLKAYGHVQALKGGETELLAATLHALTTSTISEQLLDEIERVIVARMGASIKSGPMGKLIREAATESTPA